MMNHIEAVTQAYKKEVNLEWKTNLSGPEKVWFAVYDPMDERRLRMQVEAFAIVTKEAGHDWHLCDLTDSFPRWMSQQEYRESYFESYSKSPQFLDMPLADYRDYAAQQVTEKLNQAGENDVVAILGIGTLFGLGPKARFSNIEEIISASIAGRLLVFFPGEHNNNNYRLLDARDGWNYLARPITGPNV